MFEAFDEEIVVVNLDSGNYYSLSASGPHIWVDLANGFSLDEVVDRLGRRYAGERDVMSTTVRALITQLVDADLLVEATDVASPGDGMATVPESDAPFQAPVVENYTDMQDLLLLDPIHDVDDAGWPAAKPKT